MRTTRLHLSAGLVLATLLAGCGDKKAKEPELAHISKTLPNLLLPVNAAFVSRSGSAEALSILLRTPGTTEEALSYYRRRLVPPLWRLVSESKDNLGATVLYAEQDGPPLWVRVWPDSANNGTFVRLTGAAVSGMSESSPKRPEATEQIR